MTTAITAIKANFGVTAFAYLFTILAGMWSILWSVAISGTMEQTHDCSGDTCTSPNYGYLFLLFLSFFFAHQVIQVSRRQTGRLPTQRRLEKSLTISPPHHVELRSCYCGRCRGNLVGIPRRERMLRKGSL